MGLLDDLEKRKDLKRENPLANLNLVFFSHSMQFLRCKNKIYKFKTQVRVVEKRFLTT